MLETVPVTGFALEHEIGHELHLDGDRTSTLTLFAATSIGIEGEILRREAHLLGQRLIGKEVADGIVGLYVGGGIRACALANRILVDELHMLHGIDIAQQPQVFAWRIAHLTEMALERGVEDTLDETRLARA